MTSQPTWVAWVSVILTIIALIFECAMWFQGVICIGMRYASCNWETNGVDQFVFN